MTEKTYPALLLILAATVMSPSSLAQGIVEQQRCPNAEKGRPDGNGGGNSDQFTYESWVDDDKGKDGRHFRRCIENQAKKAIWTHWNGVLSRSWISVNHRLYGSTFVTRGEVDPHKTDLWWGDNKNNRIVPEAKCYKGEDSCKQEKVSSAGQFVTVQWPRPGGFAKGLSEELARALETKKDFSIRSYREFFVPADARKPNENLFKFAVSVTSQLTAGELNYSIAVYASDQVRRLEKSSGEPVFRLSAGDSPFSRLLSLEKVQFTYALLSQAASAPPRNLFVVKDVRIKPSNVDARVIRLEVLHPSGPVVASLPIPVLEGK